MKKILALVLALVMTMSVAAISSSAAFTDADSVQYTDAVNTLNALGVLSGYTDGSIKPAADVSRGAAAKMVAMVATGSNTTTLGYYAGTASFTDVPATHTFANVVAFCVGKGIVDGYGDGTYGVSDNVKGWAVAKMALVAMGYDAEAFGLTGTGAALRTIELATDVGLFDNMNADFVATEAASREECAQIVYNALTKALMVNKGVIGGAATFEKSATACLMQKYISTAAIGDEPVAKLPVFVITANQATTTGDYTVVGTDLYNVETGLDLIGHEVYMVACGTGKDAVTGDSYTNVYAVVDATTAVTVSEAETYAMDKDAFKAKFGADAVTEAGSVAQYKNYKAGSASYVKPVVNSVKAGTYLFNAEGKLFAFLASDYSVGYVSYYDAGSAAADGKITVNSVDYTLYTSDAATDETAVSYYADIAEKDIVLVQSTGDLTTLTEAATVSGTVSAINTGSTKTIVVGGVTYYQAGNSKFTSTKADLGVDALYAWDASTIGQNVVLYLNANGEVFAIAPVVENTAVDAGLVYVVATYPVSNGKDAYGDDLGTSYYVQAVNMNGETVTYQTTCNVTTTGHDHTSGCANYAGATVGALQKVTTDYDSTLKATVAAFGTANVGTGASATAFAATTQTTDVTSTTKIADKYYYASGVKFIYVSGSKADLKVEVKNGAQALDVTGAGTLDDPYVGDYVYYATKAATDTNWDVQYVVVNGSYVEDTTVTSEDIVYVYKDATSTDIVSYTDADGQTAYAYKQNVYVNGVETSIVTAGANVTAGFYKYTVDSVTGLYTLDGTGVTNVVKGEVVSNVYGSLISTATTLSDDDASSAKIIDAYYNALTDKTGKTATAALKDLVGDTVWVVYNVSGTTKTVATIYVSAQA